MYSLFENISQKVQCDVFEWFVLQVQNPNILRLIWYQTEKSLIWGVENCIFWLFTFLEIIFQSTTTNPLDDERFFSP